MHAILDQLTRQKRSRLKTTIMGLGLVRLLQDARRFDEAKMALSLLETGFQGVAIEVQNDPAFCQSSNSFGTARPAASEIMSSAN